MVVKPRTPTVIGRCGGGHRRRELFDGSSPAKRELEGAIVIRAHDDLRRNAPNQPKATDSLRGIRLPKTE